MPGKRWLEGELQRTHKTVLFVSHDRELLAATATRFTVEANGAWVHGGDFASYHDARRNHLDKREHDLAVYEAELKKLEDLVAEMRRRAKISETFAPRLKAAESRLRQFHERNDRPEQVRDQSIDIRLRGARTGKRALAIEQLELHGLTDPFDAEIWYGERVAVLGGNGAGKSHFLRLLAGDSTVEHAGQVRWAPVWWQDSSTRRTSTPSERSDAARDPPRPRRRTRPGDGDAAALRDAGLRGAAVRDAERRQQARFQILLLELSGATLLLLDEPTDNLDLVSAEALEAGLAGFQGTVVAVTLDRWFLRGFRPVPRVSRTTARSPTT